MKIEVKFRKNCQELKKFFLETEEIFTDILENFARNFLEIWEVLKKTEENRRKIWKNFAEILIKNWKVKLTAVLGEDL